MNTESKIGHLLVNLGTPDEPTPAALRRYLREFLSDPDVVDIAAPLRFLLVNAIIVPFRAPKSAHASQAIWTKNGSPLRHYPAQLFETVARRTTRVDWGMRYGNPGCRPALERLREKGVTHLKVLPLYPQFAQSSVSSTLTHVQELLKKMKWDVKLVPVAPFYKHPGFVEASADVIRPFIQADEHVLFSFHGVPERHILRSSPDCLPCLPATQCDSLKHSLCYRGQSYETANLIARRLGLASARYSISFQSRLGRTPWIKPFTDHHLEDLVRKGVKRLVVTCPSFVADCLETLEEIGVRERSRFLGLGGESLELVPCLNDSVQWADAVVKIFEDQPHA